MDNMQAPMGKIICTRADGSPWLHIDVHNRLTIDWNAAETMADAHEYGVQDVRIVIALVAVAVREHVLNIKPPSLVLNARRPAAPHSVTYPASGTANWAGAWLKANFPNGARGK